MKTPTQYDHLSVASAVTMEGRLLTQVRETAFNGAAIVGFLEHLLCQIPGKVVLIWDGATIHRCAAVKAFLTAGAAKRLRLIRLPAYAPDLNPDEGVWRWLKRQLGNVCCRDLTELRSELGLAIEQLCQRPHLIRACFEHAGLHI